MSNTCAWSRRASDRFLAQRWPSHNVFVTESFVDELAAAAKQDAVAYRRALLDKSPRAKAVLNLAAEKADWGQSLAEWKRPRRLAAVRLWQLRGARRRG
jgi:CO/xanthine dehydrogenase Mo-binding subunit